MGGSKLLMVVLLVLLLAAAAWLWIRAEEPHDDRWDAPKPAPRPAPTPAPKTPPAPATAPAPAPSTPAAPADDDDDTEHTEETEEVDDPPEPGGLPAPEDDHDEPRATDAELEAARAQLHQADTRVEAILTLARNGDEADHAAVAAVLPALDAAHATEVRDALDANLGGPETASHLVDALLATDDRTIQALLRDLLWHVAHEAVGDRALDDDDVLQAIGPLVFFQSVGPGHLDALLALSEHSRREVRLPAVYGLASLALVDSGDTEAAEAAHARLQAMGEADRSKPVRTLAAGVAAGDEDALTTVMAEETLQG